MLAISVAGNRIGDFDWHPPDFDFDFRGSKHPHEFFVELGHGARRQRNCPHYSVSRLKHKLMSYEVKPEFESFLSVGDSRCGQAPGSNVQRKCKSKPMVDRLTD